MKKLLLIPTAVFPYSFCLLLACGFFVSWSDFLFNALGILCFLCFIFGIICNIVFMILSRKEDSKDLLMIALLLKMIHITPYILIFGLGLIMGFMFFMTFPFIIFLVFIDCITLFLSGMISVFALIKNLKKNCSVSLVTMICQILFCIDIISLFILNLDSIKEKHMLCK